MKQLSKRTLSWIALAAGLGLVVGVGYGSAISADAIDRFSPGEDMAVADMVIAEDSDRAVGSNEVLILVIADSIDATKEAAESASVVSDGLAGLQGFYVDNVENYEIQGIYELSSPLYGELVCTPKIGCGEGSDVHQGEKFRARLPQQLRRVPMNRNGEARLSSLACGPGEEEVPCPSNLLMGVVANEDWPSDGWIKVSAFRTKSGAEQFVDLALATGVEREQLTVVQARKSGGGYIGLGQESDPRGGGPLLDSLPNQELHQG